MPFMSGTPAPAGFEPPSGRKLVIATGIAVVVALLVLVAIVWPAEYGKDPTGIGALLGIEGMSTAATETIEIVDTIGGNEVLREVEIPDFGEPVPLPNPKVSQLEAAAPATRTVTLELAPDARTEVKTVLEEGKVIVYDWRVDRGTIYSQFHGHNPEYGEGFWVDYHTDERGAPSGSGSLVAPFPGEHGWYWVNINEHPVTVTLTVTGYFDDIVDYSELF
jgi:hypothetical protein